MPGSNFCSIPVSFALLTRSRRRFCDIYWNKNGVSKVRASYVNTNVMLTCLIHCGMTRILYSDAYKLKTTKI